MTLISSNIRGNRAQSGGAMHVSGGATVRIELSSMIDNTAEVSGGAIQVPSANAQRGDTDSSTTVRREQPPTEFLKPWVLISALSPQVESGH
eukprot:6679411-Prymnesium_polylepis.2